MKKQAYTMIAMIVLVGALALVAQAQSISTPFIANIPFEFNVGDQKLPAGKYMVRVRDSGAGLLQISTIDGRKRALVFMRAVQSEAQNHAKLVFNLYGGHYFFAQAWGAGERTGMQAPQSRAERNVIRELAGIKPQTKAIALTTRQ